MNELINITYENERPTISGRELHAALEVKTPYTQWFDRMKEYGFAENEDFALVSQKCETNNPKNPYTTITDHQITIDMAKEICMLQRSEKGKQFRQYFIEVEKKWNTPEAVMARALKIASNKIGMLEAKIEEDKPKVVFADAVSVSKNCILVRDLAKFLAQNGIKTGEKRLFSYLRENGYMVRGTRGVNMPSQKSIEMGLFEVCERAISRTNGVDIKPTPYVTAKGQQYFINKFLGGESNDKP